VPAAGVDAAAAPEPDGRLALAAVVPWAASGAVSTIVIAVLVTALQRADALPGALGTLLDVAVVAYGVVAIVAAPALRRRTFRYAVREDEIDLVRGAVVRTRTIVPMARVQHVDTRQSPFGRLLDIATLVVHTAAARHEIPGLEARVAYALRTEIARRAQVVDEL